MSKKTVYVLYAPGGNNHRSMAQMIEETFKRKYPEHRVIIEDVSQSIANFTLKFLLDIYDNLLMMNPKIIKYGFGLVNSMKSDKAFVQKFPKIVIRLANRIKEVKPDVVVSVHPSINHFIAEALKQVEAETNKKIPFAIFCTELCGNPLLNSWVHEDSAMMIGLLEPGREAILKKGFPPEKIRMLGGPIVNPRFMDFPLTKIEARKKFGLREDLFTVMIMSGGVGLKANYHFTRQLINSNLPVQILVCCGRNEKLKAKIDVLVEKTDKNVKVFGFTDQIANLMDAADLIVTKPGPASLSEAIIKEVPIILDNISTVMTQELGNVNYILEQGLGKKVTHLSHFQNLVASLVYNPGELSAMRGNMKRVKKDESALKLAECLLQVASGNIEEASTEKNSSYCEG
jgi:UDP-N-acetylglucosamine:LPS N-acetylglucosamine transferase